MENTNNELKKLTSEELNEVLALLGKVADILNPSKEKLTTLNNLGKEFALSVELRKLEIFGEICKRF